MTKRLLIAVFAAGLIAPLPVNPIVATATAQERTPPAPTPPPAPPEAPGAPAPPSGPPSPPQAQPQQAGVQANVQLDVVITDTVNGKPEAKTLTLLLRNNGSGSVRTGGVFGPHGGQVPVQMALDASVSLDRELIDVGLTFEYQAAWSTADETSSDIRGRAPAAVTQRVRTYVQSGRTLLVSRSADPVTNRTVTVELTATIREP
jgi:hypothetical protein